MVKIVAPLEIGICCANPDRLVRFYTELLGCELVGVIEVTAEKSKKATVSRSGYTVARVQLPTGERLKFLKPGQAPQRQEVSEMALDRLNACYLTFIVDDLNAIVERLGNSGAEILTGAEAIKHRPGVSLVFARDPEQNLLEFVKYDDVASYRRT